MASWLARLLAMRLRKVFSALVNRTAAPPVFDLWANEAQTLSRNCRIQGSKTIFDLQANEAQTLSRKLPYPGIERRHAPTTDCTVWVTVDRTLLQVRRPTADAARRGRFRVSVGTGNSGGRLGLLGLFKMCNAAV